MSIFSLFPLSRDCRLAALCTVFLLPCLMRSQEPPRPAPVRINATAGLIVNSSFSNIPAKKEVLSETSVITRTPSDSAGKYRAGFSFGFDVLTGRREKLKAAFGISFSRSSAAYHYSYVEEGPTAKTGFTRLRRATEHDISEKYTAINIHAGMRNHITENLYLSSAFILNKPLRVRRLTNGYTEAVYSNNGPLTETNMSYLVNEEKTLKGEANLSFRFTAEYQFTIADVPASVYLFRNFGLIYTLPWWGLGFSYTLTQE